MMIRSLAAGSKRLDELAFLIRSESESTKAHVTNEFQQHQMSLAYNDYLRRFLESLWFPEINRRQEIIKEAHAKTFQWIFEAGGSRNEGHRWDDFVQWLKQGQSTYWIHGKAGSGKSTLMNYIYQDDRTHDSLKVWSGAKELLTPIFFFWNAGGILEKSSEGLLRSLLHQVLERYPEKTPLPAPARKGRQDYGPLSAWTERRLQKCLRNVMHQLKDTCRICVFLDGLDEFIGDQNALITTIKELQSTGLKTCLSSRPDPSYSDAFGPFATLELQYLTEADIRVFVSDKLQAPLRTKYAKDVPGLVITIVKKAKGVFLWVELVVKDVLRGLQNGDNLDQLDARLRLMPSGITDLHAHMLSNIHEIYQIEAVKLFHMAIAGLTGSLLNISLALDGALEHASELSIQDAIGLCDMTKKRIPAICAGLLETHTDDGRSQAEGERWEDDSYLSLPIRYGASAKMVELSLYERSNHVNFHHRTSVEFLQKSEQGRCFMKAHSSPSWNPYDAYVRALLVKLRLLGFPQIPADMVVLPYFDGEPRTEKELHSLFVYEVMKKIDLAERHTSVPQVLLCEDVDRTLTVIYQQRFGQSIKAHWCTQWGFSRIRWNYETIRKSRKWTASPQLSPAQSYHSAMSELGACYDPEMPPTKPVDFLGLACSWGLSCYVYQALNSKLEILDRETATYLLCCSMWAFSTDFRDSKSVDEVHKTKAPRWLRPLRLVDELLKRGADPNFYVRDFSATIWGEFVKRLEDFACILGQSSCGETVKIFIENGANLRKATHIERRHWLTPLELDARADTMFFTRHQMTILDLIRECLSSAPDCEAIEKVCLSKGVRSISKWTHIVVYPDRLHKVTDVQRDKYGPAVSNSRKLNKSDKPISLSPEHSSQIVELLKEVKKSRGYSNSYQDPRDEETTSDDTEDFHSTSSSISLIS